MHTEGETAVGRVAERIGIPYALRRWAPPRSRPWRRRPRAPGGGSSSTSGGTGTASAALVERARAAGYEALVLTVDTPVAGPRLRDVRNGFTIPPALTLRTMANAAVHPRWWVDLFTTPPLEFASLRTWGGTVAELVDRVFEPAAVAGRRPDAARDAGRARWS